MTNDLIIKNIEQLKSSNLNSYVVDSNAVITIDLNLINADLEFPIVIYQKKPNNKFRINVKVVLSKDSSLDMPISLIVEKGAVNTETYLNGKIYLFDSSKNKVKIIPSLFIHEKNIQGASHGVVIKNLKLVDIEYFLSRGFSIEESKAMLTM